MLRLILIGFVIVAGLGVRAAAQSADAVSQARRQVSQADAEQHKAMIALSKEAARIRKQIQATPEWTQADALLKDGQAKYKTAVAAVRKSLRSDPAYQKAQKAYGDAINDRDSLQNDSNATPEQKAVAATSCLEASTQISHIEQKAISGDPAAEKAHTLIQQANDQIEELKKQFGPVAQKDAAYQAAKQRLAAAGNQLASAENSLNQAKAAQAQAQEQADNQRLESLHNQLMRNAGMSH